MPETDAEAPAPADYREAFRRAARPGYDPHQVWRFSHPGLGGPGPPAASRERWLAEQLHGAEGTLDSALDLIEWALRPAPGLELWTFWPGSSASNPDFGVILLGNPGGPGRPRGVIRFEPIPQPGGMVL